MNDDGGRGARGLVRPDLVDQVRVRENEGYRAGRKIGEKRLGRCYGNKSISFDSVSRRERTHRHSSGERRFQRDYLQEAVARKSAQEVKFRRQCCANFGDELVPARYTRKADLLKGPVRIKLLRGLNVVSRCESHLVISDQARELIFKLLQSVKRNASVFVTTATPAEPVKLKGTGISALFPSSRPHSQLTSKAKPSSYRTLRHICVSGVSPIPPPPAAPRTHSEA